MSNKSIIKNSVFNIIYKGFTAIFPLLTTSYISRVILPEGVGKVAYANVLVTYFTVFAALGIPNYGVKVIANSSNNSLDRSKTFVELLIINAISTGLCCILYYFWINATGTFSGKTNLMNVMGLLLILNFINIDWFYQGIEEYSYIATRSIIIKSLSLIAMLMFVKTVDDYVKYAFILCLATAGNYSLNFINVRKHITWKINEIHLKPHIKPILILLAATIATEIYTMLDTVMIEYFHGDISVGYYSNAVKIVRMGYTVTVALVATFYPRISKYYAEKNIDGVNELLSIGTKTILLFCIPFTIGMFLTADLIVPVLFGNAFNKSILVLKELSILIAVFSFAYFLGHVVLMSTANEDHILKAAIVGAITNAILNLVLIPKYAENGAAIASVVSEIAVTIILIIGSKRYFKLVIEKRYIVSILIASSTMTIVVYLLKKILTIGLVNLFVIFSVAGVVYFLILLLMKNELMLLILNKIKARKW